MTAQWGLVFLPNDPPFLPCLVYRVLIIIRHGKTTCISSSSSLTCMLRELNMTWNDLKASQTAGASTCSSCGFTEKYPLDKFQRNREAERKHLFCSTINTLKWRAGSAASMHSFELQLHWQNMTDNWCNLLFTEKKQALRTDLLFIWTWGGSQEKKAQKCINAFNVNVYKTFY